MPQSSSKVGTLGPHTVLPVAISCPYFPKSQRWSEISSLSKVILVLGKTRSCWVLKLGCRRAESRSTFSGVLLLAGFSEYGSLSTHSQPSLKHSCQNLVCAALIVSSLKSLLSHPNSFHEGMLKLNAKFNAHLLLYLLSHFECDGHAVHMLTQWYLPLPLTGTVMFLSLSSWLHLSLKINK